MQGIGGPYDCISMRRTFHQSHIEHVMFPPHLNHRGGAARPPAFCLQAHRLQNLDTNYASEEEASQKWGVGRGHGLGG